MLKLSQHSFESGLELFVLVPCVGERVVESLIDVLLVGQHALHRLNLELAGLVVSQQLVNLRPKLEVLFCDFFFTVLLLFQAFFVELD